MSAKAPNLTVEDSSLPPCYRGSRVPFSWFLWLYFGLSVFVISTTVYAVTEMEEKSIEVLEDWNMGNPMDGRA